MTPKEQALTDTVELLKKQKLTVVELIDYLTDLTFSIGTSVAKIDMETVPSLDELQKQYWDNPNTFKDSVGIALILQSNLMKSWLQELTQGKKNDETTTV